MRQSAVLLVLFASSLGLAGHAEADWLQFQRAGAFAAYAPVHVGNALIGYTDAYGRIFVGGPAGPCSGRVTFMGQDHPFSVQLFGTDQVQTVSL